MHFKFDMHPCLEEMLKRCCYTIKIFYSQGFKGTHYSGLLQLLPSERGSHYPSINPSPWDLIDRGPNVHRVHQVILVSTSPTWLEYGSLGLELFTTVLFNICILLSYHLAYFLEFKSFFLVSNEYHLTISKFSFYTFFVKHSIHKYKF